MAALKPAGEKFKLPMLVKLAESGKNGSIDREMLVELTFEAGLSEEAAESHSSSFFSFFDHDNSGRINLEDFVQEFIRMGCFRLVNAFKKRKEASYSTKDIQKELSLQLGAAGGREQFARLLAFAEEHNDPCSSMGQVSIKTIERWYWTQARRLLLKRKDLLKKKGIDIGKLLNVSGSQIASKEYKGERRKVSLLLVGLDNAGKTTLSKTFQGEEDPLIIPTCGFEFDSFYADYPKENPFECEIYDLAGDAGFGRAEGLWHNYFGDAHGIVFVVDSTDTKRIKEVADEFRRVSDHKGTAKKPLCILANKQDLKGAMSGGDVAKALGSSGDHPCKLFECVAREATGERGVGRALKWMLTQLDPLFDDIDKRVQKYKIADAKRAESERKEKRERLEKQRKEVGTEEEKKEEETPLDARGKVAKIFSEFDRDKDGFLNFDEFQALMSATDPDGEDLTDENFRDACDTLGADHKNGLSLISLWTLYSEDEGEIDAHYEILIGP
ncbi:hypothetical protein AAMO2058_001133200 [Amorphochlora amoebiformis]